MLFKWRKRGNSVTVHSRLRGCSRNFNDKISHARALLAGGTMTAHPETLHYPELYANGGLTRPNSDDHSASMSQQTMDYLRSSLPQDCRHCGSTVTNWNSEINLEEAFGTPNLEAHSFAGHRQDSICRASFSSAASSTGAHNERSDAFDFTTLTLPSSQPHIDISTISRIKTEQTLRRREQNKKSQRAYRERRSQYASNLESKVEEMNGDIEALQIANRDLLQRLSDLRATNNILRCCPKQSETPLKANSANHELVQSQATPSDSSVPLSEQEVESLFTPYLAVWNLMSSHLPPNSSAQDVASVLDQLHAMAIRRMTKSNEAAEKD